MSVYSTSATQNTQASFNTMRYEGRDSESGIGRRLYIIRPGATTVVAPSSVGSMTTKGQMNPTSRVSITASQAGENSQTNGPEHTIVSRILTDLNFKRSNGRRAVSSDPPLNQRSSRVRATNFKTVQAGRGPGGWTHPSRRGWNVAGAPGRPRYDIS
jgi:hypothetical protein